MKILKWTHGNFIKLMVADILLFTGKLKNANDVKVSTITFGRTDID